MAKGIPEEIIAEVQDLHSRVSRLADALTEDLGSLLVCRAGCHECCIDDLSIFPIEAEIIRRQGNQILKTQLPHPPGKCAFLDQEGSCRIYPWRPYVCRTQGLPLRWWDEDLGGKGQERRDICRLNAEEFQDQGMDLDRLSPDQCWTLGDFESALAGLQVRALGSFQETLPRLFLRDLFESS